MTWLGYAPYVLYGVRYIDLVPLAPYAILKVSNSSRSPFFEMAQNLDLRCVLLSGPGTLGAGAKPRLHTPKAVTYHEQSYIMKHT